MGDKIELKLGDGATIFGDFIVANSIKNSFDKVANSKIDDELQILLKKLTISVGKMLEYLSVEDGKSVAKDLDRLIDEAASEKPDKRWWQVSVDGLKKAAETIGEIGKPILEVLSNIVAILTSISR